MLKRSTCCGMTGRCPATLSVGRQASHRRHRCPRRSLRLRGRHKSRWAISIDLSPAISAPSACPVVRLTAKFTSITAPGPAARCRPSSGCSAVGGCPSVTERAATGRRTTSERRPHAPVSEYCSWRRTDIELSGVRAQTAVADVQQPAAEAEAEEQEDDEQGPPADTHSVPTESDFCSECGVIDTGDAATLRSQGSHHCTVRCVAALFLRRTIASSSLLAMGWRRGDGWFDEASAYPLQPIRKTHQHRPLARVGGVSPRSGAPDAAAVSGSDGLCREPAAGGGVPVRARCAPALPSISTAA